LPRCQDVKKACYQMKFSFSFTLDSDGPPEPTGPADVMTLTWICCSVVLMIAVVILVKVRARKFFPLRSISALEMSVIVICGTVDPISTFIANDQFESLRELRHDNCPLWSYWLEYPAGIAPLFVLIISRMIRHACMFHFTISTYTRQVKKVMHNWTVFGIFLSILAICGWITVSGASHFDEELQTCVTEYREKITLFVWIFLCSASGMILVTVLQRGISKVFIDEWMQTKKLMIFISCVFILDLVINVLGLTRYSIGRSLFTITRTTLYPSCLLALTVENIIMSFKSETQRSQAEIRGYLAHSASIWSIVELSKFKKPMATFLDYCVTMIEERVPSSNAGIASARLLCPQRMVECYKMIETWRESRGAVEKGDSIAQAKMIINLTNEMDIPESIRQNLINREIELPEDIFSELHNQLLEDFQVWGDGYLKTMNNSMLSSRLEEENELLEVSNGMYLPARSVNKLKYTGGLRFDQTLELEDNDWIN